MMVALVEELLTVLPVVLCKRLICFRTVLLLHGAADYLDRNAIKYVQVLLLAGNFHADLHLVVLMRIITLDVLSRIQAAFAFFKLRSLGERSLLLGPCHLIRLTDIGVAGMVMDCGTHSCVVSRRFCLAVGEVDTTSDLREFLGLIGEVWLAVAEDCSSIGHHLLLLLL